jgi:PAS domain S-box-containing protein
MVYVKLNDLKKTPEFLENVLETMSDGLMLVDREGTILSFNLAAEQITGYRREEVIGKPCAILDTDTCVYREGGRTTILCNLFEKGRAVRKNCRIRAKDGREIHLLKNAIVLRDEQGEMIGGIETMTDVTSLVVKDRQIRELGEAVGLQQQFKGIVGRSPVMLRIYEQIRNAAGSEAPVIVFGESGTGKNWRPRPSTPRAGVRRRFQTPRRKRREQTYSPMILTSTRFLRRPSNSP